MTPYSSKSGKETGITGYKIGEDFIAVKFKHREKPYMYTYRSAGMDAIEQMKSLAESQRGLSTYISQKNPLFE